LNPAATGSGITRTGGTATVGTTGGAATAFQTRQDAKPAAGTFDADPRIDCVGPPHFGYSAWRNFDLDRRRYKKYNAVNTNGAMLRVCLSAGR